ncbi:hypothetical protein P691DRAFT_765844 [Macrolepiota fuliginosa MF-IS2]|uniref:Uncharacterized protein n=1 Tax=Macrolepiota fuliginosa MF-IS2 TaxID=1400762 RepID=A0A9P5X2S0_9AGAR|nr:hypothetical protein P691DRAFT_765844 [Macrolepiota fuliginosa MF-IS2]
MNECWGHWNSGTNRHHCTPLYFNTLTMKFSYLSVLAFVSGALSQVQLHPDGNTNKCLDVQGSIFTNRTAVQMYT